MSPRFRTFRWYALLAAIAIDIAIHIVPLVFLGSNHASRSGSYGYQTIITSLQLLWILGFTVFIATTVRQQFLYKRIHAIMIFSMVILASMRVFLSSVIMLEPLRDYAIYKHITYTLLTSGFILYIAWAAIFRSDLQVINTFSYRKKLAYVAFISLWFASEYISLALIPLTQTDVYSVAYVVTVSISIASIVTACAVMVSILLTDILRDDENKIDILQSYLETSQKMLLMENSTRPGGIDSE